MNNEDQRQLGQDAEADLATRRQILGWAGKAGVGAATLSVLGGGLLAGCGSSSKKSSSSGDTSTSAGGTATSAASAKTMKIGVIVPISGFAAFVGEVVKGSLDAALGHIKADMGGSYKGIKPEIKYYDATLPAEGQKAYQQALSDKMDAIIWGGAGGLVESLGNIAQDKVLVISAFSDLQSYSGPGSPVPDLNSAKATGLTLFQTSPVDTMALSLMLKYCKIDRGYDTTALIYDKTLAPVEDKLFAAIAQAVGIKVQGIYSYDLTAPDYNGPLQKLRDVGTQSLFAYGVSDNVAGIAKTLVQLDAKYVDTPTAKSSKFKPQLLGSPGGTGDASFVRKAGDAAARGTITAWYIGGIVGLPSFPMRDWIKKYVPSYNGGIIKGGEDTPADSMATVLEAAVKAGSFDGTAMTKALEDGVKVQFASPQGFSFGPTKHVSLTPDDMILVTLSYPDTAGGTTEKGFNLGKEWTEVFAKGYQGPTTLMDFTLEDNRKVAPALVDEILNSKYGTSCRPDFQGNDQAKVDACKKIN